MLSRKISYLQCLTGYELKTGESDRERDKEGGKEQSAKRKNEFKSPYKCAYVQKLKGRGLKGEWKRERER